MSTPFDFTEQKHSFFNHALRVFIFGEDVTPWLTGELSINYADRSGVNICSFQLSNQLNAFDMTENNLDQKIQAKDRFRTGDPYAYSGIYSEQAKSAIYQRKKKTNITHAINTFGPVAGSTSPRGHSGILSSKRDSSKASSTTTDRYPFTVGSLVFHKYDPVRVFVLNPLTQPGLISEQNGALGQQWWCAFTGYIDTKPYTVDFTNGLSTINITCQDIRVLMQSMRTQTNPAPSVSNDNALTFHKNGKIPDSASAGFFNDLVSPTNNISHVLGGRTFKQSLDFLLLGINAGQPVSSATSDITKRTNVGGVGRLAKGETIFFDPKSGKKTQLLEDWNNLVIFGDGRDFMSFNEMSTMGSNTYPGGDDNPDNALIHYLYPKSGAPPETLVEYSNDAQVNTVADWSTRLELLQQVVKAVDYQFYVSPIGDIIFEFPMYDFFPEDYDDTYNELYTFDWHNVSNTIDDEGGEPISALVVTSRSLRSEINRNNPTSEAQQGVASSVQLTRTIFSNVLASRIGPHVETYSVPGVSNQNRLTQLGMIEFTKRVANFDRFDMNTSFRPFILTNRAIYNETKERIGITSTTKYSWKIREEATLSMSLGYTRKLEKDGAFRFITGGEATPISYSAIYDPKNVFVEGQGVNSDKPVDGAATPTPVPDSSSGVS